MARYKVNGAPGGGWIDTETGRSVPNDPTNADYRAYLAWDAAPGNTADPADPPPPRPIPLDYGADDTSRDQLQDAVTTLRAYLGVATPTAAQSAAALKIAIRVVLYALRRLGE